MFKVQCSEFSVQGSRFTVQSSPLRYLTGGLDRTESKAVEYFGMANTGNPFGEQEERLSGV
jgi:hypothetical protein